MDHRMLPIAMDGLAMSVSTGYISRNAPIKNPLRDREVNWRTPDEMGILTTGWNNCIVQACYKVDPGDAVW